MGTCKVYPYKSVLAPYILDYIAEKRSLGFVYNTESYELYRFDCYWDKNGYDCIQLSADKLDKWICQSCGEGKSSQSRRIGAVKGFAIYMNTHGVNCDIPLIKVGKDHPKIHILDKTERTEFFASVDSYVPMSITRADFRMADEYPVIFRLYYCCGMRNNEVCSLKTTDIDLAKGIITIYDGKGNKDRLVYLAEDMKQLMSKYHTYMKRCLGYEPYWFFPGRYPDRHIPKTSVDRRFKALWNKTASSRHCDKAPTPHSLRHSFVVDRINSWILAGIDINVMFLYLSKYLGHKDPDESYYYYHLASDAFRIIRQKDTMTETVLPEVRRR